jgi:hypothetical protein
LQRKKSTAKDDARANAGADGDNGMAGDSPPRNRNGSWQRIEALREKAALKASLADVWDDDFDLDEEILAELDHNEEFFTTQEEAVEEDLPADDEIDEFYEDDDDV